jgi:hypothetical protein
MASSNIAAVRQHTPRLRRRRVCFASALRLNSTEQAADRSRSTGRIDICDPSVAVITSSPSP